MQEIILDLKSKYDLETILNLYDNKQIDFNYHKRMKTELEILKKKEEEKETTHRNHTSSRGAFLRHAKTTTRDGSFKFKLYL